MVISGHQWSSEVIRVVPSVNQPAAGEGASSDEGDEKDEEDDDEEGEGGGEEAAEDEGVKMVRRLHKLGNASALDSQLKVR